MQKQSLWLMAGALAFAVGAAHAAPPAVPGAPAGWVHEDIGGPGAAGDSKVTGTGAAAVWTVSGSGSDIQGSADQFQYAYTTLMGDGGITARVLSQTPGDPSWTKTGVMLRESDAAGSRMATFNFTSANGSEVGYRTDTDGSWSGIAGGAGQGRSSLAAGPIWLRVQHKGTDFQVLLSDDGKNWTFIDHTTIAMDLTKPILAGLDVTSHMDGSLATATYDTVTVDNNVIVPPPVLGPVEVTLAPTAVLLTYADVPNAVGYNIYRRAATDTPDKAVLVNAQPDPYSWFIDDNGGKGLTSGTTYVYQVKAVMKDSSGNPVEGAMSAPIFAEPQTPIVVGSPSSPVALTSYDIGTQTVGSTMLDNSGVLTISGSGADIQGINDGMRFVGTPMTGDYSITAKIMGKPAPGPNDTSTWIKAGVMIRDSLNPGAVMANMFLSSGNGINYEQRRAYRIHDQTVDQNASFGGANPVADGDVKVPVWLRLTRKGDNIEGGYSTDGTTFTNVDPPNGTYPNLSPFTYAGLAVTAHQEGALGIAKFDATSIKIQ
jgi:regulation of enolase protein 1 (concanavalin A-like superfamily)